MSTLSSSNTRDQVMAAIVDNASYEEDNDIAKAKAYLTALRIWKNRWAFDESNLGASRMRFDGINRTLMDDIKSVQAFINANAASSSATSYAGYSLGSIEESGR